MSTLQLEPGTCGMSLNQSSQYNWSFLYNDVTDGSKYRIYLVKRHGVYYLSSKNRCSDYSKVTALT